MWRCTVKSSSNSGSTAEMFASVRQKNSFNGFHSTSTFIVRSRGLLEAVAHAQRVDADHGADELHQAQPQTPGTGQERRGMICFQHHGQSPYCVHTHTLRIQHEFHHILIVLNQIINLSSASALSSKQGSLLRSSTILSLLLFC